MRREAFAELLSYIQSHPADARALQQALQTSGEEIGHNIQAQDSHSGGDCMVTASAAGDMIGKSSRWVRLHRHIFPTATMKDGTWYINKHEVIQRFNQYINDSSN